MTMADQIITSDMLFVYSLKSKGKKRVFEDDFNGIHNNVYSYRSSAAKMITQALQKQNSSIGSVHISISIP